MPIWASNGGYMQTAAAHSYYGTQGMDAIRAMRVPKEAIAGYRYGGAVGDRGALLTGLEKGQRLGYATGGAVDAAGVAKLILSLLDARTSLVADIIAAQKDLNRETALIRKPQERLDSADRRYDRAVDRRDNLRDRVADLKRAADATKGTTKADREYKGALADLRDANNAVTRSSKEKRKAQEAYDAVSEKAKEAADRLKEAQDALADSARQVSNAFRDTYLPKSTDAGDLLQLMKDGAKDLTAFTAQVDQLRKLGLNETTIQQVVSLQQQNPQAGADLASQITAGGKGLVDQLNAANDALQRAADNLGYLATNAPQRKAAAGLVTGAGTGTSDSVHLLGSNGEFMQPTAAVNHYGLRFMQDVQHLRYQPAAPAAPHIDLTALRSLLGVQVHIGQLLGGDPYAVARAIANKQQDRMAAAGLSMGIGG